MSRKQLIILGLTVGFIVLVVVLGFISGDGLPGTSPSGGQLGNGGTGSGVMEGEVVFTPEVPENAAPTVPEHESPAAPGSEVRLGFFDMTVSAAGYEPSTLTVKLGNLVRINLTAVGGDYDWYLPYLGLSQTVREGETKQVNFQATGAGTYLFECRDLCPLGRTIQGQLVVTP